MESIQSDKKILPKKNVGLDDARKVRKLMTYLSMTPDEFSREFGVIKEVMNGLLDGTCKLSSKIKVKVSLLYPEISKIWLEYGIGNMTSGLIPNRKIKIALEKIYGESFDDIKEVKDIIYHISRSSKIKYKDLSEILDFTRQIRYNESIKLSKFLGVKYHDILSEDLISLNISKSVISKVRKSFTDSYSEIKDFTEGSGAYIEDISDLDNRYSSPIYLYLRKFISPEYLTPCSFSNEVNIRLSQAWYMFKHRKKLNIHIAKVICDRFGLDIKDMQSNKIIESDIDSSPRENYKGEIYEVMKDKIKGMSITTISYKTGINRAVISGHLHGNVKKLTNLTAKKYCKGLGINEDLLKGFIIINDNKTSTNKYNIESVLSKLKSSRLKYYVMSYPGVNEEILEIISGRYTIESNDTARISILGEDEIIKMKFNDKNMVSLYNRNKLIFSIHEMYLDVSLSPRNLIIDIAKENLKSYGFDRYIEDEG